MLKKLLLIFLILAVFGVGIYLAFIYSFSERPEEGLRITGSLPESSKAKVESYIREHISELSPEEEVLGGKFHVTKVEFTGSTKALVEYEDGHNAFVAEAEFFLDPPDFVKVLNFTVIQRN